jgi:Uma2 family endonuclease
MTATATLDCVDPIRAHDGPWTEEDYLALGEGQTQRIELIDGELIVSPVGNNRHQKIGERLSRELERVPPQDIDALHEANVRLRLGRIVIPDVVVTANQGEWLVVDAAEVLLVAEVVSPTSGPRDRVLKPSLCAEAGIPWYLLVERYPKLELTLFRRRRTTYAKHATVGEGDVLDLPDLGCSVEIDALLRRS